MGISLRDEFPLTERAEYDSRHGGLYDLLVATDLDLQHELAGPQLGRCQTGSPDGAGRSVDGIKYLLNPEVEIALAKGPAGQIPLNPDVDVETRVETLKTIRPMEVDFEAAAAKWDAAAKFIENEFKAG